MGGYLRISFWGELPDVGEFAIHKVIVHKVDEDYIIFIDELGAVLSILLAMEVEELITLWRSLPILLLVLNRHCRPALERAGASAHA
jgi:hypothetical protein